MPFYTDLSFYLLCTEHRTYPHQIITVVLHINTKQSAKFELYAGKGGHAMSLTKLVSQGAVDNCTNFQKF